MATARKLPSGKWRVRQYIKGHDPEYVSFTSEGTDRKDKAAVEKAALEYKEAWERTHSKSTSTETTLGEAIDAYCKANSAILSPETIRGYKKIKRNYLQPLMDMPLRNLTQSDVQAAVNADSARHSTKTVLNAHGLLATVVAEYCPDFTLRTKLPKRVKHEIAIPSKEDVEKLLAASRGSMVGAIILLGAVIGLRRSEICALTWVDVDRTAKTISINKAMVQNSDKEWVIKTPKSYSGYRVIAAPQFAIDYLDEMPQTDKRIVPMTPMAAANRFRRLAEKHGVNPSIHALRHYNASVMLSLGVPDKYAMERMGHATPNMLKAVYQHTMRDKQQEIADQIDGYYGLYDTKYDTKGKK